MASKTEEAWAPGAPGLRQLPLAAWCADLKALLVIGLSMQNTYSQVMHCKDEATSDGSGL